jgi:bifunctional DNA-binding transcriptional regulator/antitoxin component of YhaV-PrlF toxin-antitoxin module
MILSKVLSKYQITLPKEIVKSLRIKKGYILKCEVKSGSIVMTPVVLEEAYSKGDLESFRRMYQDPKNSGKIYTSKHKAMEHLKSLHARD